MDNSLNKRVLLFSSMITMGFILCLFGITYLIFRINIMTFVRDIIHTAGTEINTYDFLDKNILNEFIYSVDNMTSDALILRLFWQQYNQFFLVLLISGIIFMLILTFGIKYIMKVVVDDISNALIDDSITTNVEKIPTEILPLFQQLWEIEKTVEQATAMNNQFRTFAAHELRNQLTQLKSRCYQMGIQDVEITNLIQTLQATIENLLMLSYVPDALEKVEIDVPLLLATVIDSFSMIATINFIYDEESPELLAKGVENLLYRAFYNIIDNACKYRRPNTEITTIIKSVDEAIIITVRNNADTPDFSKINGHGFGLKLVQHVIQIMQGYYYQEISDDQVCIVLSLPKN